MNREMPDTANKDADAASKASLTVLERFEKLMETLGRWTGNIGMVFLFLLMLIITVDVFLRVFFNSPIKGVNELAEYSLLIMVFLTISFVQSLKANISVDILYSKFPPKLQMVMDIFTDILCLVISVLMLRQSIVFNRYLATSNGRTMILKIPQSPVQFVMVIGLGMLSIVFLIQIINFIIRALRSTGVGE